MRHHFNASRREEVAHSASSPEKGTMGMTQRSALTNTTSQGSINASAAYRGRSSLLLAMKGSWRQCTLDAGPLWGARPLMTCRYLVSIDFMQCIWPSCPAGRGCGQSS